VDDFCDIQSSGRRVNKNHSWKHFELRKKIYDKEEFKYSDILFDLSKECSENSFEEIFN
jgi:hypothetical protein